MSKLKVEEVNTSELIPYARNSRTHSEVQVSQIAGSIKEFGFNNPVLIDESNGIIAGHGRVMAAQKLGLAKVPCIRLEHLSETQRRAYVIADNKIALNAGWDFETLSLELQEISEDGFDLTLTGFEAKEIENLFLGKEKESPDEFEEFSEEIETDYKCPKCAYEWSGKAK
jgi:ParB-like chromosome segregation protein Spo0J